MKKLWVITALTVTVSVKVVGYHEVPGVVALQESRQAESDFLQKRRTSESEEALGKYQKLDTQKGFTGIPLRRSNPRMLVRGGLLAVPASGLIEGVSARMDYAPLLSEIGKVLEKAADLLAMATDHSLEGINALAQELIRIHLDAIESYHSLGILTSAQYDGLIAAFDKLQKCLDKC